MSLCFWGELNSREDIGSMGHQKLDGFGSLSQGALDRFIYIIGSARGGTSVLFDAIGVHDEILALPGMTHFMNQVWRYRHKVHMRLLRQIFRLPGFYDETEVVSLLEKGIGRELKRYIAEALDSRDLKRMWQVYPVVYALDMRNNKKPGEIKGWADKANDFYGVERVAQAFPKGKFVFIVRDPRGAVSSLAKRMAVKEEFTFEARIDGVKVIEAAISWRRMTQQILHFAKRYPERSMVIRMEDFLTAPTKTLSDIFQLVGVDPVPEEKLQVRLSQLSYGASNNPDQRGTGIHKEPMDRWKSVLTEDHEGIIQKFAGKTASKIGYEIHGKPALRISQALRVIPSWRQRLNVFAKWLYLQTSEIIL